MTSCAKIIAIIRKFISRLTLSFHCIWGSFEVAGEVGLEVCLAPISSMLHAETLCHEGLAGGVRGQIQGSVLL